METYQSRRPRANRLIILNFHGLGDPLRTIPSEEEPFWLDKSFFEAILDLIHGRDDVRVTFDDANSSDHEIALPVLKARNISARMFILAQHIDEKGYLSLRQLRELVCEGMIIGNHGLRHYPWTTLSEQALCAELLDARNRLEQFIGTPVTEAACPFGMYDRRVLRAVRHAGCERLYTSDDCPAVASSWIQSRYTILRTHNLMEVRNIIGGLSQGLGSAWPSIKHKLKQLR